MGREIFDECANLEVSSLKRVGKKNYPSLKQHSNMFSGQPMEKFIRKFTSTKGQDWPEYVWVLCELDLDQVIAPLDHCCHHILLQIWHKNKWEKSEDQQEWNELSKYLIQISHLWSKWFHFLSHVGYSRTIPLSYKRS